MCSNTTNMSRARDWDKVGRQRRAYMNGAVPKSEYRPASNSVRRISPKFERLVEEDEFGEWTILCLDFTEIGGKNLPNIAAYSYDADAVITRAWHVMKVKYACVNIPQSARSVAKEALSRPQIRF